MKVSRYRMSVGACVAIDVISSLLNGRSQETDVDRACACAPKLPGLPSKQRVLQTLWVVCWTSKTCAAQWPLLR